MNVPFIDLLIREWNLLLMAAVWIVMATAEAAYPEGFEPGRLLNRLEPVIPLALCVGCARWIPGPWMPEGVNNAQKLILGVVLGWGAYNFTALAKRLGVRDLLTRARRRRTGE